MPVGFTSNDLNSFEISFATLVLLVPIPRAPLSFHFLFLSFFPFFASLFFTGGWSKRRAFIVWRRAYPAETNDRAHKVGSKKHRVPSLKLIYVTIIFNNAKRARTIQSRVMGNFLRAVSLLTLIAGTELLFFFLYISSFSFAFFLSSPDEGKLTADVRSVHLTSLDRLVAFVNRVPLFYLSRTFCTLLR